MSKPYIAIGHRTSKRVTTDSKEEVWAFGSTPRNARAALMSRYRDATDIHTAWVSPEDRRKYRDMEV